MLRIGCLELPPDLLFCDQSAAAVHRGEVHGRYAERAVAILSAGFGYQPGCHLRHLILEILAPAISRRVSIAPPSSATSHFGDLDDIRVAIGDTRPVQR